MSMHTQLKRTECAHSHRQREKLRYQGRQMVALDCKAQEDTASQSKLLLLPLVVVVMMMVEKEAR